MIGKEPKKKKSRELVAFLSPCLPLVGIHFFKISIGQLDWLLRFGHLPKFIF